MPTRILSRQDRRFPLAKRLGCSSLKNGGSALELSKEHLRFVEQQPCLICGRSPSHAHHIRFAQSRGVGLKVSDEFTVPLCAIHHQQNHATGNERQWWQEHKIDPLAVAMRLWRSTDQVVPIENPSGVDTK
jgi:hypothetical protein